MIFSITLIADVFNWITILSLIQPSTCVWIDSSASSIFTISGDRSTAVDVGPDDPFVLHPGEFVLGVTYELVAWVTTSLRALRSHRGPAHALTAGFVTQACGPSPWSCRVLQAMPILLYPGMKIGQLCFFDLSPAEHPPAVKAWFALPEILVAPVSSVDRGPRCPRAGRFASVWKLLLRAGCDSARVFNPR